MLLEKIHNKLERIIDKRKVDRKNDSNKECERNGFGKIANH